MTAHHPYVIISDADCPEPAMVCQWVAGIGYCYLDRSWVGKTRHDGMQGKEATPIEAFGFTWTTNEDGIVEFNKTGSEYAEYSDGKPRRWQSSIQSFKLSRLKIGAVQVTRGKETGYG